jgi:hypothetical protein
VPSLTRALPLFVLAAAAVAPAGAQADVLTLGSNLQAPATVTEAHGSDTAFWAVTVAGQGLTIPADGQIMSIKVKGTVRKQAGAADPATLIHFQSLEPAAADGSRKVWLSSEAQMPIGQPGATQAQLDQVTTFTPENLCVHKDGAVSFNDIGGFRYGGSLSAPIDPDVTHYPNGAPFQIFGAVRGSSTARYTAGDKTNNGDTLLTSTPNQNDAAGPVGTVNQGEELLMQVVVATGSDAGVPCKNALGIPWSPGGSSTSTRTTPAPRAMKIRPQADHVSSGRALGPMIYCPGKGPACTGTGTLTYKGKVVARGTLNGPGPKTLRIPMKISAALYKQLRRAGGRTLSVTFAVSSSLGTYSRVIQIKA